MALPQETPDSKEADTQADPALTLVRMEAVSKRRGAFRRTETLKGNDLKSEGRVETAKLKAGVGNQHLGKRNRFQRPRVSGTLTCPGNLRCGRGPEQRVGPSLKAFRFPLG